MGLKLGLGLRVWPNPNPLFFLILLFLFPLKAFTGLGLGLVNPFSVQIYKELFSFLAAPALFLPRGGGGDRGSSDVRHPRSLCRFFYPIRVRVTHWQPGSGTNVRIE